MSTADSASSDLHAPGPKVAPLSLGEAARPPPPSKVIVQASVLLGVSDHQRRITERSLQAYGDAAPPKRAVGCLVGTVEHGVVTVTNSFPVPFEEGPGGEDSIYLDVLFQREMFGLYHKVYSFERVVGWYSTAGDCQESDARIHSLLGFEEDKVLVCMSCEEPATATDLMQPYIQTFYFEETNGNLRPRYLPNEIVLSQVEKVVLQKAIPQFSMETYINAARVMEVEVSKIAAYLSRLTSCKESDLELVAAVQDAINAISIPRSFVDPVVKCEKNCLAMGYAISEVIRSLSALHTLYLRRSGASME